MQNYVPLSTRWQTKREAKMVEWSKKKEKRCKCCSNLCNPCRFSEPNRRGSYGQMSGCFQVGLPAGLPETERCRLLGPFLKAMKGQNCYLSLTHFKLNPKMFHIHRYILVSRPIVLFYSYVPSKKMMSFLLENKRA